MEMQISMFDMLNQYETPEIPPEDHTTVSTTKVDHK